MNKIIFIVMMALFFIIFMFFIPLLDYHYICKDSMTMTHISIYDIIKGNHLKEGCQGFAGMDIIGQMNYNNKTK